jgi:hypothetical protein
MGPAYTLLRYDWQAKNLAANVACGYERDAGAGSGSPVEQFPACTGGHGTEPWEQNTQQSPALGRNRTEHPLQS